MSQAKYPTFKDKYGDAVAKAAVLPPVDAPVGETIPPPLENPWAMIPAEDPFPIEDISP